MSLGHLKRLGAIARLESAEAHIAVSGLCHGMHLHPYEGSVSVTGALMRAFDISDKTIAIWDGDVLSLELPDTQFALFNELRCLLEMVVDEDIDTWSDNASADDAIRACRRLARIIEFGLTG